MKAITPETIVKAEKIANLITKYVRKKITPEEQDELDEWIGSNYEKNYPLFKEMTNRRKIKKALKILSK